MGRGTGGNERGGGGGGGGEGAPVKVARIGKAPSPASPLSSSSALRLEQ